MVVATKIQKYAERRLKHFNKILPRTLPQSSKAREGQATSIFDSHMEIHGREAFSVNLAFLLVQWTTSATYR